MKRAIIAAAAVLALLTGCSAYDAAHNHNAPTPTKEIGGQWTRIDTPGNFPSVVFRCVGRDGIYEAMDSPTSVEVVANDPRCP